MTPAGFGILVVEDDADDVVLLKVAFEGAHIGEALQVVGDGEEAVAYLLGQGAYADRARHPLPSLILLDLKLPRKSGLEVLEWRRQAGLWRIPVIVLTSSQSSADIARAYELGANSYLVKPLSSEAQLKMVETIGAYWIGLNKTMESDIVEKR